MISVAAALLSFFLEGRRDKCEDIAAKFHMLGKMGEVAEVAAAGVFLCSRDAGFITGKTETKTLFFPTCSMNLRQLSYIYHFLTISNQFSTFLNALFGEN